MIDDGTAPTDPTGYPGLQLFDSGVGCDPGLNPGVGCDPGVQFDLHCQLYIE